MCKCVLNVSVCARERERESVRLVECGDGKRGCVRRMYVCMYVREREGMCGNRRRM